MKAHPPAEVSVFADLPNVLSSFSTRELAEDPQLCALLAEYSSTEFELGDWYSRQPARRNSADFRRWITEGRAIFDRRDEVKRTARQFRWDNWIRSAPSTASDVTP